MKEIDEKILKNIQRYQKPVPEGNTKSNVEVEAADGIIDIYTSKKLWVGFKKKRLLSNVR